jgi:hypothetical protein
MPALEHSFDYGTATRDLETTCNSDRKSATVAGEQANAAGTSSFRNVELFHRLLGQIGPAKARLGQSNGL